MYTLYTMYTYVYPVYPVYLCLTKVVERLVYCLSSQVEFGSISFKPD